MNCCCDQLNKTAWEVCWKRKPNFTPIRTMDMSIKKNNNHEQTNRFANRHNIGTHKLKNTCIHVAYLRQKSSAYKVSFHDKVSVALVCLLELEAFISSCTKSNVLLLLDLLMKLKPMSVGGVCSLEAAICTGLDTPPS